MLLIFTSIWSTLSKSTQWDLYRVINIPQLSGLPLPCSKSSYHSLAVSDTPGYRVLLFPRLQFTAPLCREKGKNQSFAWTLTHLFIKLILVSMFTSGNELSDRAGGKDLIGTGHCITGISWKFGHTDTFPILSCYHRFSSRQLHAVPTPHMAKPGAFVEGARMYPVPECPRVCSNVPTVFSEMRRKLCVLIIPGAKHEV